MSGPSAAAGAHVSPTPAPLDPRLAPPPQALPATADVLIIGGGVAGLRVAAGLARSGARVVLAEAGDHLARGISGRGMGLALAGLLDHPNRLVASLGPDVTADIWRFTLDNLDLLDSTGALRRTGSLALATDARELPELQASAVFLQRIGVDCGWVPPHTLEGRYGILASPGGLWRSFDGHVDTAALFRRLLDDATTAGAHIAVAAPVRATNDPTRFTIGAHTITADVAVYCAGWALRDQDAWFADKLYPVRAQLRASAAPSAALPNTPALSAQYGYVYGRPNDDGGWTLGGCRWGTRHLEVGEVDEAGFVPIIDEKLEAWLQRHMPSRAAPATHRWTSIMAFTCDGLPLLGPLPGRVQHIACTGFAGRPHALALRAADAVVDGLLDGHTDGVPACFSPSRFL